jgi:hypothetical protein
MFFWQRNVSMHNCVQIAERVAAKRRHTEPRLHVTQKVFPVCDSSCVDKAQTDVHDADRYVFRVSAIVGGLIDTPVRLDVPFAIAGIEPRYRLNV